jgi:hypothetical protein
VRSNHWVCLGAAVSLALATTTISAAAQSGDENPKATEVGVTDTEIRLAVIADVDTSLAPGLFQGSVDGAKGLAKFINASGGLAGRKVVIDFIDSKLSADDARNAIIKACDDDFAMIGTSALFLNNVDDQAACSDVNGDPIGIPDLPFVTTEVVQQCSPITYPMAATQLVCSTKDEHPQTYQAGVGRGYYYKKKYGNDLHGIYLFGVDLTSARNASFASLGQVRHVCCKSDGDFDISARATQSLYTPFVQLIKDEDANYAQSASSFNTTVALRKEATLQGVTDQVKVWDCGTQCYDAQFLEQGGADVENQYVDLAYLPFFDAKERKANKMLANFVKYTGKDKVNGYGVYAWAAGIALRDGVNAIVEKRGINAVTRQALLDELNKIHDFDAEGMWGRIDLAGRKSSGCHVLTQVQSGKFVRVYPTKPGTFDCARKNAIEVRLDLLHN